MGAISGIFAAKGAKKARKSTQRARDAALSDLQLGFSEASKFRAAARAEFDPFLSDDPGAALNQLRAASGAAGRGAQQEFFTSFEEGPQVEFLRERGLRGIDRGAAAGGNLGSGGRLAALTKLSQGFALQSLNQQLAQLGGVANREQNIAAGLANQSNLEAQARQNLGRSTANIRIGSAAQIAQLQRQQATATGNIISGGINDVFGSSGFVASFGNDAFKNIGAIFGGTGPTSSFSSDLNASGFPATNSAGSAVSQGILSDVGPLTLFGAL